MIPPLVSFLTGFHPACCSNSTGRRRSFYFIGGSSRLFFRANHLHSGKFFARTCCSLLQRSGHSHRFVDIKTCVHYEMERFVVCDNELSWLLEKLYHNRLYSHFLIQPAASATEWLHWSPRSRLSLCSANAIHRNYCSSSFNVYVETGVHYKVIGTIVRYYELARMLLNFYHQAIVNADTAVSVLVLYSVRWVATINFLCRSGFYQICSC